MVSIWFSLASRSTCERMGTVVFASATLCANVSSARSESRLTMMSISEAVAFSVWDMNESFHGNCRQKLQNYQRCMSEQQELVCCLDFRVTLKGFRQESGQRG